MTDPIAYKVGDIVRVPEEHNAFNRRNGKPRFKAQEVLAILQPGESACDYGFRGRVFGYLNTGEQRLLVGNAIGSRRGDMIFWPFKHEDAA